MKDALKGPPPAIRCGNWQSPGALEEELFLSVDSPVAQTADGVCRGEAGGEQASLLPARISPHLERFSAGATGLVNSGPGLTCCPAYVGLSLLQLARKCFLSRRADDGVQSCRQWGSAGEPQLEG